MVHLLLDATTGADRCRNPTTLQYARASQTSATPPHRWRQDFGSAPAIGQQLPGNALAAYNRPVHRSIPSEFNRLYGTLHAVCSCRDESAALVLSRQRGIDLQELDQLWADVGWGALPLERVQTALENSLLLVGLWLHEPTQPRLVGFARCIGDGVRDVIICDVAISPAYQGIGLGKQLMAYVLDVLRDHQVERATLFADPEAVKFYLAQGWQLEPEGRRCAYWHESEDERISSEEP